MDCKAFLATNVAKVENKKVVISNRFKDDKGQPIKWELKTLSADDNDVLERRCYVNVPIVGRKGQFTRELDRNKYTSLLLAETVVFPDLNNAELQDSYGVKTPEDLLKKMLTLAEYNKLAEEMANASSENLNDLVDEAKN
jgi:hypothetical protein